MQQVDDKPQQATELAAPEEELANARAKIERLEGAAAEGHSMLIVGCILAAIAGIGLITGAMLALTVDTQHVTTAGVVAAISAGAMLVVVWVAFVVNWYRKRTMPVQEETPVATNGSRSKPLAPKRSPSRVAAKR
jgi:hypothetical protein